MGPGELVGVRLGAGLVYRRGARLTAAWYGKKNGAGLCGTIWGISGLGLVMSGDGVVEKTTLGPWIVILRLGSDLGYFVFVTVDR